EPNLALVLIDLVDSSHDVGPGSDDIFELARLGIDQVEVPTAVALCHVDDLVRPIEPGDRADAQGFSMGRPDESLGLLVDQNAAVAGRGIDFDQSESLVAAVRLFICEMAAVFPPAQSRLFQINPVDLGL